MRRVRWTTAALAALALGAGVVASRGLVRRPAVERPLPPSPAAAEHVRPAVADPDFSPASPAEARGALGRVFGDRLALDQEEAAVGDFNGDGAPDLAAAVHARSESAAELLDPLANWTVQDCPPAPAHPAVARHRDASPLAEGEALVAVVHGYGARGWRDPEARQAYIVRGGGQGRWSRRAVPDAALGRPPDPAVRDVLAGPVGSGRFVFWGGGRYNCASIPGRAVASAP